MLQNLAREGVGLLLVEQNITVTTGGTTDVAQQVAIMVNGRIVTVEQADVLAHGEALQRRHLGVVAAAEIYSPSRARTRVSFCASWGAVRGLMTMPLFITKCWSASRAAKRKFCSTSSTDRPRSRACCNKRPIS